MSRPVATMLRVRLKGTDLWLGKVCMSTAMSEGFHPGDPFYQWWKAEQYAKVFTRSVDLRRVATLARGIAKYHAGYDPTGPRLEVVYPNGRAVPLNDLCPEVAP